ncbi:MAG: NUDIX domain-containing protein [Nitrososphaerales archaeon]|nr:NUDIX domain-containing protein [Nitrososphaerales archaeon]
MGSPPRIVVGAGILVHRKGRILLVKRGEEPDRGMWSFPGGMVELGETTEEAAVREVREEVGLTVEIERLFDVATYLPGGKGTKARGQVVVVDYLGRPRRGRVRLNHESSAFGWFAPGEVQRLDATSEVKLFAKKFARLGID